MFVFFSADPSIGTTTLQLAGGFLGDIFPYVQPIIAVVLVIVVVGAFIAIARK